MSTESANDTGLSDRVPLSAVFMVVDEPIVDTALEFRGKAPESVRAALNSAIKQSIKGMKGFRDASVAPLPQLKEKILYHIIERKDDRLAGATLRVWAEANGELRDLVVEHLQARGLSADYPDFKRHRLMAWDFNEWETERRAIAERRDDLDEDDVGLMLCYVSGRFPRPTDEDDEAPQVESPLFLKWVDELNELPLDAPEWAEIPELVEALSKMTADRIVARDTSR